MATEPVWIVPGACEVNSDFLLPDASLLEIAGSVQISLPIITLVSSLKNSVKPHFS